jgi:hypothetical protein
MRAGRGRDTKSGGAGVRPRQEGPRYFTNGVTKKRMSEISST